MFACLKLSRKNSLHFRTKYIYDGDLRRATFGRCEVDSCRLSEWVWITLNTARNSLRFRYSVCGYHLRERPSPDACAVSPRKKHCRRYTCAGNGERIDVAVSQACTHGIPAFAAIGREENAIAVTAAGSPCKQIRSYRGK